MAETTRPSTRCSSTGADHRDDELGVIDEIRTTSIFSSLSRLFLSEKFSDLTIICHDQQFKAHKAVVCSQSPFFDKAMTSGFAESSTEVINLPDDDPEIVRHFLQFLYSGNYDDGVNPTWGKSSAAAMMTVDEINQELSTPSGVEIPSHPVVKHTNQRPPDQLQTAADRPAANKAVPTEPSGSAAGGPDCFAFADDSEYVPDENESSEPEEEYNEFDGDDDAASLREPVESMIKNPNISAMTRDFANFRKDLFVPMRLYVMADKYDVPALRLLARDRFYHAAQLQWRDDDSFPDLVDELYDSTPDTDIAMREIVCRLVSSASSLSHRRELDRMVPVMRKHGDFAVGVLHCILAQQQIW